MKKCLSSLELKILAAACLLLGCLGRAELLGGGPGQDLGRVAWAMVFPIGAFLAAEGVLHSERAGRYLLRVFLLAVISEMSFDILFNYQSMAGSNLGLLEWESQNPAFALFYGLVTILAFKAACGKWPDSLAQLLGLLPGLLLAVVAELTNCYAGMPTVVMIFAVYLWRSENHGKYYPVLLMLLFAFLWRGSFGNPEALGILLGFVPLFFYNGQKGKSVWRYVFYAPYPVFLFGAALLRYAILGIGDFIVF